MHPLSTAIEALAKLNTVRGVAIFETSGEELWLQGEYAGNPELFKSTLEVVNKLDALKTDKALLNYTNAKVYCTKNNTIGIAILTSNFQQADFESTTNKFYELYTRYSFSSATKILNESAKPPEDSLPPETVKKLVDIYADIIGAAGKILFRDSVKLLSGNPNVLLKENIGSLKELINLVLDSDEQKKQLQTKWDSALK